MQVDRRFKEAAQYGEKRMKSLSPTAEMGKMKMRVSTAIMRSRRRRQPARDELEEAVVDLADEFQLSSSAIVKIRALVEKAKAENPASAHEHAHHNEEPMPWFSMPEVVQREYGAIQPEVHIGWADM